jgi:calcineurin-like phosphoesterase family protein
MNKVFFIGDTHFGHKNIMIYEKDTRNFSSIEEHNEVLIDRWNSVVNKNDIVWHLGDVAFGKSNLSLLNRLKGKKRLILGNHDVYPLSEYQIYFDKIFGVTEYKGFILSHIPVHPTQLLPREFNQLTTGRYKGNIHGHLHHHLLGWPYLNVSAEHNNLTPIGFDDLLDKYDMGKD